MGWKDRAATLDSPSPAPSGGGWRSRAAPAPAAGPGWRARAESVAPEASSAVSRLADLTARAPLAPLAGIEALRGVFKEVAPPFDAKVEKARAAVAAPLARAAEPVFDAIKFAQDRIPQEVRGIPTALVGVPPRLPGTPAEQAGTAARVAAEVAVPSALDLVLMAGAEGLGVAAKGVRAGRAAARAAEEAKSASQILEEVGALQRMAERGGAKPPPISAVELAARRSGRTHLPPTEFKPVEVPSGKPWVPGEEILLPGHQPPAKPPKLEIPSVLRPRQEAPLAPPEDVSLPPAAEKAAAEGVAVAPDVRAGVEAAGAAGRPPSFWQTLQTYLTRSGETTLKGQGAAGEELANALMRYASDREVYAGTRKAPFFNELLALSPAEKDAFREFLDKGVVTQDLSPRARLVAEKAKGILDDQGKLLEEFSRKHGVTVDTPEGEQFFHRRKNFFPHEVDWDAMATSEGRAAEIQNLVATGQVKSPEAAAEVVDAMLARQSPTVDPTDLFQIKAPSKRLAQELKGRRMFDLVNIVRDPVVALENHFRRVGNSVAKVEIFGKDYERLYDMVSRIAADGGDAESAGAIALQMIGFDKQANKAMRAFLREVKGFEALKLGTAFVANAPQGILNSWIRSGSFTSAAKGFRDLFTAGGKDFAMKAGISSRNVEKYIQDSVGALTGEGKGFFPKVSGFLLEKLTPFKQGEMANRVVAANAARYYVQDKLVPMFLRQPSNPKILRELKNFGLDAAAILKNRGVSEAEVLTAANIFSNRRTQFMNDALSMPLFSQDPWGRLVFLFKTFAFQQSKMLKESMQIHGAIPTAARLGIAATVVGIPVSKLRSLLSAKFATEKEQGDWASDFLSGLAAVGGLGLVSDAFQSAKFGTEGAMGSIAGPVIQDAAEAVVSTRKAVDAARGAPGGSYGYGLEQIIRRVPIVGPPARNILKGAGIFGGGEGRKARPGRAARTTRRAKR